ncbi:hypothetical protein TNIN_302961 [Trichonephila inaurata madagascariensis]|uniref:Uncharacterized protein n=1 Tax=Trichonephila inaurata madagascariensis TaxID=2747483 RepID=A0A8X6YPE1_9ARAC|nr:hypothetical protein TNIN_302961 [Trichonephila inaurata madagascariensis]
MQMIYDRKIGATGMNALLTPRVNWIRMWTAFFSIFAQINFFPRDLCAPAFYRSSSGQWGEELLLNTLIKERYKMRSLEVFNNIPVFQRIVRFIGTCLKIP